MRNVQKLMNLSAFEQLEITIDSTGAQQLLNAVLAMAGRDQAISVHYHTHRIDSTIDGVLTYVVGGIRYELVPPLRRSRGIFSPRAARCYRRADCWGAFAGSSGWQ